MSHIDAPTLALVKAEAIALMLNSTKKHIYELAKARRIPHIRIGKLVRFDQAEVSHWLDQRRLAA